MKLVVSLQYYVLIEFPNCYETPVELALTIGCKYRFSPETKYNSSIILVCSTDGFCGCQPMLFRCERKTLHQRIISRADKSKNVEIDDVMIQITP
jgi:hypothetical protein